MSLQKLERRSPFDNSMTYDYFIGGKHMAEGYESVDKKYSSWYLLSKEHNTQVKFNSKGALFSHLLACNYITEEEAVMEML